MAQPRPRASGRGGEALSATFPPAGPRPGNAGGPASSLASGPNFVRDPAGAPRPAGPNGGGSPPRRRGRSARQHPGIAPASIRHGPAAALTCRPRRPAPARSRLAPAAPALNTGGPGGARLRHRCASRSAPRRSAVEWAWPLPGAAAALSAVGANVLPVGLGRGSQGPRAASDTGPRPPGNACASCEGSPGLGSGRGGFAAPGRVWGRGLHPPPGWFSHRTPPRQPGPPPRGRHRSGGPRRRRPSSYFR